MLVKNNVTASMHAELLQVLPTIAFESSAQMLTQQKGKLHLSIVKIILTSKTLWKDLGGPLGMADYTLTMPLQSIYVYIFVCIHTYISMDSIWHSGGFIVHIYHIVLIFSITCFFWLSSMFLRSIHILYTSNNWNLKFKKLFVIKFK